jgi:putative tricarboxylic transport membrane protein
MRKPGEIIVGLCFLAIGIGFTAGAVKLQIGVPTEPRPGFFPFMDGIILIVLSALFLIYTRSKRTEENDCQVAGKLSGPILIVLTLILYVATLEMLGYVITTALLSAVVLKVMETKLRVLVLVSLILPVVSYLIFDRLLGVTLPRGLLAAFW